MFLWLRQKNAVIAGDFNGNGSGIIIGFMKFVYVNKDTVEINDKLYKELIMVCF